MLAGVDGGIGGVGDDLGGDRIPVADRLAPNVADGDRGKERIAAGGADRPGAHDPGAAGDVGGRLRPDAILRAAADGEDRARFLPGLATGLEDPVGAGGDPLSRRRKRMRRRPGDRSRIG
jgi:hypothetical protein